VQAGYADYFVHNNRVLLKVTVLTTFMCAVLTIRGTARRKIKVTEVKINSDTFTGASIFEPRNILLYFNLRNERKIAVLITQIRSFLPHACYFHSTGKFILKCASAGCNQSKDFYEN
jgi:hypothetical protein